jgi:hypothetical protein
MKVLRLVSAERCWPSSETNPAMVGTDTILGPILHRVLLGRQLPESASASAAPKLKRFALLNQDICADFGAISSPKNTGASLPGVGISQARRPHLKC